MGFTGAADVVKELLKRCADQRRILYELTRAKDPDSLPPLRFEVAITDLSSLLFQLFSSAQTGREVLERLQFKMDEDAALFGVRTFVYCLDDRASVTPAKMRERQNRDAAREKYGVASYGETITLKSGAKVPAGSYEYKPDGTSMPADFSSVMATPQLMKRTLAFICSLLAKHVTSPSKGNGQSVIFVSGMRKPGPAKGTSVLKRVFLDGESTSLPSLDLPACPVGEGEGQMFHWVRRFLSNTKSRVRNFLVRANDSDSVAIGLSSVPLFYCEKTQKIDGTLWYDGSSSHKNVRFINLVRMWRQIKERARNACQVDAAPGARHVQNDVESALVVAMFCGNDYCDRLPLLGPGTLFKAYEVGLMLPLQERKRHLVRVDYTSGEMRIDEAALMALVARAYIGVKGVRDTIVRTGNSELAKISVDLQNDRTWLYDEKLQRRFFDGIAKGTADGSWMRKQGKSEPKAIYLLDYDKTRAAVRRAFFSFYYFFNISRGEALLPAFLLARNGESLFGHEKKLEGNFAQPRAIFSSKVLTHCLIDGKPLQPFMKRKRENQLKNSARKSADEEDSPRKKIRDELVAELSGGPSEAWLDVPLRVSEGIMIVPRTSPHEGEHGSFIQK